ncbi:unnamed protein product [Blepharisma stoltei]|uniref:[Histone H3]-lysine(27) N-trimethyltransferase n=1 Tax=Blepharisma stoltei TaxID=1481888 RepID=A0AAU9KCX9_9CILI|nr:unnamed protein product [Blepharisma stoltei]
MENEIEFLKQTYQQYKLNQKYLLFTGNRNRYEPTVVILKPLSPSKEITVLEFPQKLLHGKSLHYQLTPKNIFTKSPSAPQTDRKANFCNKCYIYSCRTHLFERYHKKSANGQNTLYNDTFVQEIDPTFWKQTWRAQEKHLLKTGRWLINFQCKNPSQCGKITGSDHKPHSNEIVDIVIRFLKNGISNPCSISLFLAIPCNEAWDLIKLLKPIYFIYPETPQKLPELVFTDKEPAQVQTQNIVGCNCNCKTPCNVTNSCPCMIGDPISPEEQPNVIPGRQFCEKFCLCNSDCKQRFLGCNCELGACNSTNCVCFAAKMECDPDLCKFCKCSSIIQHPENFGENCKNLTIQLEKWKRTALSQSTIEGAGLGLFILESCKKGEMIVDYKGEMLEDAEADRRGLEYDKKQHSFIFNIDSRYSIDATFYGNKMRYVNHKSQGEQNCMTSIWRSLGNTRIVLIALKDLEAGMELFFDYQYPKDVPYDWYQNYTKQLTKKRSK